MCCSQPWSGRRQSLRRVLPPLRTHGHLLGQKCPLGRTVRSAKAQRLWLRRSLDPMDCSATKECDCKHHSVSLLWVLALHFAGPWRFHSLSCCQQAAPCFKVSRRAAASTSGTRGQAKTLNNMSRAMGQPATRHVPINTQDHGRSPHSKRAAIQVLRRSRCCSRGSGGNSSLVGQSASLSSFQCSQ